MCFRFSRPHEPYGHCKTLRKRWLKRARLVPILINHSVCLLEHGVPREPFSPIHPPRCQFLTREARGIWIMKLVTFLIVLISFSASLVVSFDLAINLFFSLCADNLKKCAVMDFQTKDIFDTTAEKIGSRKLDYVGNQFELQVSKRNFRKPWTERAFVTLASNFPTCRKTISTWKILPFPTVRSTLTTEGSEPVRIWESCRHISLVTSVITSTIGCFVSANQRTATHRSIGLLVWFF